MYCILSSVGSDQRITMIVFNPLKDHNSRNWMFSAVRSMLRDPAFVTYWINHNSKLFGYRPRIACIAVTVLGVYLNIYIT